MKNYEKFGYAFIGAFLCLIVFYNSVYAIPAFARKYGLSCSTCHDPFPRLKEYGEEFAGNAFQLPDGEEPPRAYRNTGDERLTLMRELPLGMRFDAYYSLTPDEDVTNDLKTPWGLKVLSGGNIAKDIGYYLYFFMSERGEVAGIEDAYVHFNNIGGSELDVMIGQFQISDPLLKRELRLTFEDYQAYKTQVGLSRANLKYDRGVIFTLPSSFGTDFALEVLNGNGKDESEAGNYDFDSGKSFFFRALQDFKYFNLGGFVYSGNEKHQDEDNTYRFWGPDLSTGYKNLDLTLQYVHRKDDNPLFTNNNCKESIVKSYIGELIYTPRDYLYTVLLYNKTVLDNNLNRTPFCSVERLQLFSDYETLTFNVTYLKQTNFKLMAEFTRDIQFESNRIVLGFVTGF